MYHYFLLIKKNITILKNYLKKIRKKPYRVFGNFIDSYGNSFPLLQGLRDDLKPGWQAIKTPQQNCLPSIDSINQTAIYIKKRMSKLFVILNSFSLNTKGKTILEIGCGDGQTSYLFAMNNAAKVIGSDISTFYIKNAAKTPCSKKKFYQQNQSMKKLREKVAMTVFSNDRKLNNVNFIEDDICSSKIASSSCDYIFSWEVLEHLKDPEKAFAQMSRILKPNGIMFHEYNPFFAINGGHSACTLDFPWGHVRLDAKDFIRYINEVRSEEKEVAKNFYESCLNRMTITDLHQIIKKTGFENLSQIFWSNEKDFSLISPESAIQAKTNYPNATVIDLITPKIWILLKKHG
jgi:ubiquinone/menaquinone biosynthesis C-methylase UbiE